MEPEKTKTPRELAKDSLREMSDRLGSRVPDLRRLRVVVEDDPDESGRRCRYFLKETK